MTAESARESRVLVLNSVFQPINIVSFKDALKKLVKSAVEVVHVEDGRYNSYNFASWAEVSDLRKQMEELGQYDELIGIGGFSFVIPRVIRVLSYSKTFRHPVRLNRKNVFARDKSTCQYCGKHFPSEKLNLDHVVPNCQGGLAVWENLVCACFKCNTRKGGRTPTQAGMKLLRQPFRPAATSLKVTVGDKKYRDWDTFVSDIYWTVDLEQ